VTGDDEPSVLGAGCGVSSMPTRLDAERAWQEAFAARLVARGALDFEAATACAAARDVDLSESPATAADDEMECWDGD